MKQLRAWMFRFGGLFRTERQEQELAAEMESHLQFHIEDNLRSGMTPEQARRDAILKLGGVEQTKQAYRERSTIPFLENLLRDVRYALRQLRKSPGFTITAVLTLALGIGAITVMFSVIRAVLLKPLDYHDPDHLVLLSSSVTPIHFNELVSSARSYAGIGAYSGREDLAFSGDGQPEVLKGVRVSGNFIDILGVSPVLGRSFLASEDKPGARAGAGGRVRSLTPCWSASWRQPGPGS